MDPNTTSQLNSSLEHRRLVTRRAHPLDGGR